ncbi:hypothetical protein Catovirus_1_173 [Catovirus CTV1]|uniref:Uncharacterized protein n=1 Tax=Catovirus CTV1 TaxID=1977631 RepID=A0A1V0S8U2_9VIRU|nr:hypothetical protein Catovirus_1_173 [Catovirus CTV1]
MLVQIHITFLGNEISVYYTPINYLQIEHKIMRFLDDTVKNHKEYSKVHIDSYDEKVLTRRHTLTVLYEYAKAYLKAIHIKPSKHKAVNRLIYEGNIDKRHLNSYPELFDDNNGFETGKKTRTINGVKGESILFGYYLVNDNVNINNTTIYFCDSSNANNKKYVYKYELSLTCDFVESGKQLSRREIVRALEKKYGNMLYDNYVDCQILSVTDSNNVFSEDNRYNFSIIETRYNLITPVQIYPHDVTIKFCL